MSTTDLHRLLYVSSAVRKLSAEELERLLAAARITNGASDITGVLLYADGDFMQLLEGPADAVRQTFARIERSSMHRQVIVLLDQPAAERQFGRWSMAYSQATWAQLTDVQAACRASGDAATKVLASFALAPARFSRAAR
ncbi:MAG: BLUF domain-containing protein [Comamonadaceae bacterium]|nr:MAG: BLUF domain-containing protein [Comamonadaceae bacterium]